MDWLDIKEFISDTFKYMVLIVVVILTIIYVFSFVQVVGPSMNPNLKANDLAILSKIHYRLFEVKRFDIISLKYDDTKYLIKRVIGLPGEAISYKNGLLYVNDLLVDEPYLKSVITNDFDLSTVKGSKDMIIPKDMYLVLGDNRSNSLDSRDQKVGLIKKSDIIGKIIVKIFPFNEIKLVY